MTVMQEPSVAFETNVAGSGGKTGIVVPEEVISALGAGRRPAVHVDLNGYAYRGTVAVMGAAYLIGVNAGVREATGLAAGDPVRVTLTVAGSPRDVDLPRDLAEAMAADLRLLPSSTRCPTAFSGTTSTPPRRPTSTRR